MEITSKPYLSLLNIVDGIIQESVDFSRENMGLVVDQLEELICRFLTECDQKTVEELVMERYQRFRKF